MPEASPVPDDDAAPGLDLAAVTAWFDERRPGTRKGRLRARLLAGGRSNLTYSLDDDEHRWVLRRPPLGHVLSTAHDMAREFRVISALHGLGGNVPVPAPVVLCQDAGPLGVPWYVMERVDGRVVRSRDDLRSVPAEQRDALSRRLVDTLAALHDVDPEQVGLSDFGRPDGYAVRQVDRWSRQLAASRCRELAGMDDLRDALAATVPTAQRATVVHGDFRLDNLLVRPSDWHVSAVLDWEMATLGDPLADLGLLLVYWGRGSGGSTGADSALSAVADTPSSVDGFASGEQLAAHYGAATGLDLGDLPWYVAFGYFKLAVILEGIHYRFQQGQTVGSGFERIGAVVPGLVAAGRRTLGG